ncbi:MAG: hypothetical protein Q8S17_07185 [Humidesulfovibrio sp.]|nr:hypothetical protein [Humidesulfovibrio sp.]
MHETAIQTMRQLSGMLRDMHCDLGQGFLCSTPMLLKDVPQAIRLKACVELL